MQQSPKNLDKKRADEKLLVSEMIALYCRKQHDTPKGALCPECQQLHDYALACGGHTQVQAGSQKGKRIKPMYKPSLHRATYGQRGDKHGKHRRDL